MLLPITILALVLLIPWSATYNGRQSGVTTGLWVWAVAVLVTALPVLDFSVEYSVETDAFVASCLVAITAGYSVVAGVPRTPPTDPDRRNSDIVLGHALAWIGILGNLMLLANALNNGVSLSAGFLSSNLGDIRETNFQVAQLGSGGALVVFGSVLSAASYVFLAMGSRLRGVGPWVRPLTVGTFGLITIVALFNFGGRQPIVIAILIVLLSMRLRDIKILRIRTRTIVTIAAGLLLVFYFATTFASQRQVGQQPEQLLRQVSRAAYPPWLGPSVRGDNAAEQALFQLSYFSSPLPSLTFYMDAQDSPGPLFGAYSFPLPASALKVIRGGQGNNRWQQVRVDVFRPFVERGYSGNVWATWLRDLFVDFGYFGAIVFSAIFGAFMAWARNRYEATGGALYHVLEVYAALTFAFGAFQSLLYLDFVAYGFFFAWIAVVVQHVRMTPAQLASRR